MREDLSIWISQCETCEENKPPHKAIRAPLGSMSVGAPLDRIATDILGPSLKNDFIMDNKLLLNLSTCPLHLGFLGVVLVMK
jgi:hypothetical protein